MCPRCRGDLSLARLGEAEVRLACARCGVEWPVVDGIPWMTEEHARRTAR